METRPLYPDDIVARKSDLMQLAVVERTVEDIDSHTPYPGQGQEPIIRDRSISQSAFGRFLRDGIPPKDTVLIRLRDDTSMELLPTSKVKLIDRSLLIGDIVKRSSSDAVSGVILQTSTKCSLQPMCDVTFQGTQTFKGILPPGKYNPTTSQFCVYPNGKPDIVTEIPSSELRVTDSPTEEDLVVYKDWIGRVEAITNNIQIRLSDNCVVEIPDESGEHVDGALGTFAIGDIAKTKKGNLRRGHWIFGQYNANTPPVGTVVSVRTVEAEISWLQKRVGSLADEPPSSLERPELESPDFQVYDRTRRPTQRDSNLSYNTISNSEIDVKLDTRVRFKDLTGACLKYNTPSHPNRIPKLDRMDNLGYDLNVFDIVAFSTEVVVQWQDLTITTDRSIDLVPDGNIDDEHAAWPSEITHSLNLQPVLGMDGIEQPEKVGIVHAVNAAERMATVKWSPDSYIHYSGDADDEGEIRPIVAHAIRTPVFEEEVSLYDIEAPAPLNVRRGDIVLITKPATSSQPGDAPWLGEIVDTPLDGTFVVRLGAASEVRDVVMFREEAVVAVRSDGTDDLGDPWGQNEMDEDEEDEEFSDDDEGESIDEWESGDEEMIARYEDENGDPMDEEEVENEEWESADEEDAEMQDAPEHQTPPTSQSATPTDTSDRTVNQASQLTHLNLQPAGGPLSYSVLDGDPPSDHHFANEPATTSSNHMRRTQKEHKILRNPSTLPQGVYIRTYETRLDLLRVLLVGPTETPYENAPFVVDFYLPPAFPTEPPQSFFHSWPAHASIGALGRVNPNLYEDGKICLSLLGTWEGNKGEGWNAARSTLLQVIVSLLGLVLVREPYYNEAGYEALVGTESTKRPSALYSERIFLRAKGFLITAITSVNDTAGLKGFEDVVNWLYRRADGPKLLDATIKNVEEVLQRSDGSSEPNGLTVMSKGACVSLKRVLERLNELKAKG
ncbi:hypothetical protein M409DRAFT_52563 [Zasmidium cellare ATCC 36951]|uniref:UBC core domain-containing protein n=1 Tax=Zasmidium cellare ATCC 36951 TaxID=1080233 RepID=A0A6A6CQD7_ZASCE|nr:uncharacterized protein M409DRAFT_52563 [Zasmidium cellare ATCC 36951]KAF2169305.1 hypothetical protein M409DRAFT_52563 [Zasmidium cellare ATCC 36951]